MSEERFASKSISPVTETDNRRVNQPGRRRRDFRGNRMYQGRRFGEAKKKKKKYLSLVPPGQHRRRIEYAANMARSPGGDSSPFFANISPWIRNEETIN